MGSIAGALAGSVVSGLMSKSAAGDASDAMAGAAASGQAANKYATDESLKYHREALAQERAMYDEAVAMGKPYRTAGERALEQYESFLYGTKVPTKTPTQYDTASFEAAMARYNAPSTTAPLDRKAYNKLDQTAQGKYELKNGQYVLKTSDMSKPVLSDFIIDNSNPYNLKAYEGALAAYNETNKSGAATTLNRNQWKKLSPEEQAKYTQSGNKYTKSASVGKAPSLADFKNAQYGVEAAPGTEGGEPVPFDDVEQARMEALMKTPGYQFQMNEGQKALERGVAARSGTLSGAASKALTRFGQGLASTSFDSFMNRVAGIAGQGASAAGAAGVLATQSAGQQSKILGGMGSTMMASADNAASLYSQAGAAQASGYLGQNTAMQGVLRDFDFGSIFSGGGGGQNGMPFPNAGQNFGQVIWG